MMCIEHLLSLSMPGPYLSSKVFIQDFCQEIAVLIIGDLPLVN